jgi:glutamate synthase (NADPH/NADH) large chain
MSTAADKAQLQSQGLYDPSNEHDACGVGFVAHIKGQKSHAIVGQALKILETSTTVVLWVLTRSWGTAQVS